MSRRNRNKNFENKLINSVVGVVEKTDKSQPLGIQLATRQNSADFYNSIMSSLPNPDPVLTKMRKTIEVYEDLMFDSRVTATVSSRKSAILSMEWRIAGENEAENKFYEEIFKKYKMEDTISEMLDAALFGYKPMEIVWQSEAGKIIPAEFIGKPSRWFVYDNNNNLRFLSYADMLNGIEVPDNKFVVVRKNPTYDNPYGKAALSGCFWAVTFRKSGLKFWTIFLEKYGMPFLMATAEAGATEARMSEIADMLNDMVTDAVAVVPDGYKLEIKEAAQGKGSTDSMHKVYLDVMNTEIAMAILGTNLTTEVQSGSLAASQSHMQVREDIIESDRKMVEGAFNELIRITHSFNFTSEPPKFKLFKEEGVNTEQADLDKKLYDTGVRFTEEHYRKKYNLDENDFYLETEPKVDPVAEPANNG